MEEESGQEILQAKGTSRKGVVEWGRESRENAIKSPVKTRVTWKKSDSFFMTSDHQTQNLLSAGETLEKE